MLTRGNKGNRITVLLPHNQGILLIITFITLLLLIRYREKISLGIYKIFKSKNRSYVYCVFSEKG